jgi:hypothetical protein
VYLPETALLDAIESDETEALITPRGGAVKTYAFNLNNPEDTSEPHPIFADVEVREAIVLGFDRWEVVRRVLLDQTSVPATSLSSTLWENPALEPIPYDPDRAAELLEHDEGGVDVNWKVFTEGFLEGYHLRATHRDTFLPFGYANLTIVEHNGPHSRVTFPFRRIEALRDQPAGQRPIEGVVTTVDHLFPNVIVARLSHHTTVVVVEPVAVDRSILVTYRLTNRAGDGGRGRDRDRAGDDARRDRAAEDDGHVAQPEHVQAGRLGGLRELGPL